MSNEEIENLNTLGLDDTFPFSCKACGKCCKNRHDIILTPYDVYRLARYLGRTTTEIISRYCEIYEGEKTHLPVVRVLPQPPDNRCPFLRNKKCSVHTAKPVLCRVYPLSKLSGGERMEVRYYYNNPFCSHRTGSVKVRDWIADVASEESDRAGIVWVAALNCIVRSMQSEYANMSDKTRSGVFDAIFKFIYLPYNTEKDFADQCIKNIKVLRDCLLEAFNIEIGDINEFFNRYAPHMLPKCNTKTRERDQ